MKRKKGFSLIEIILSVAVLSILSIFVVKMFLLASTLNDRAEALDESVVLAEQLLQRARAAGDIENLMADEALGRGTVAGNELQLMYDQMLKTTAQKSDAYYIAAVTIESVAGDGTAYKVAVQSTAEREERDAYVLESKTYE
ncbi:type IV pilus modification PilV family protein [Fusibacter sp. JL298sf-3]